MIQIRHKAASLVIVIAVCLANQGLANAKDDPSESMLSLDLAMEAATEAVKSCEAQGWHVSVSIVDSAGNVKLQAKGDHSSPHTKDTSFRKAYTQVSMGPIRGFDTLGIWIETMKTNPSAAAIATIPNFILVSGAVAVKIKGEIVAAIGVGGAPDGDKDEACAMKGLEKIKDRLPH